MPNTPTHKHSTLNRADCIDPVAAERADANGCENKIPHTHPDTETGAAPSNDAAVASARPKTNTNKFTADHYPWLTAKGGADKLADSQVAPLIALARGNISLSMHGPDKKITTADLREATLRFHLPDLRTTQGKAFKESLTKDDVLLMPWYSITDISNGSDRPTVIQYRPAAPAIDEYGRERKYEFVAKSPSVLGIHPSTPHTWLRDNNRVVLIAEGQLKADAALTGALLDAGVPFNDLKVAPSEETDAARQRLTNILDTMPADKVPLLVEMAGIHNWRTAMADLNRLKLDYRTVWLGVDGDLVDNMSVYNGTKGLWETIEKRNATPMLLAPIGMVGSSHDKVGIDDFLAHHGDWADLLELLTAVLPEPAQADDWDKVGQVRCNDAMTHLEKCQATYDTSGQITGVEWVPTGLELAGRLKAVVTTHNNPSNADNRGRYEAETINDDGEAVEESVEIEIGWFDHDLQMARTELVTGPARLLGCRPGMWARRGAVLPVELLEHPHWPPKGNKAWQLLRAIKGFRYRDTVSVTNCLSDRNCASKEP